ncbi:FMN-binding protein [Stomatobaculum longum]|uniref:FMN-binding protein n=1 Tax=Stomatobaculum longum TaxID=796942 RepID=UPI0028E9EFBD|nr:FMN-binding protein [Stomatobaculum longum]
MSLVLCLAVTGLCFSLLEKQIRRRPFFFYLFFVLLSLLSIFLPKQLTIPPLAYLINRLLRRGVLAGALFLWVMYAIVLPQKSRLQRVMMSLRAQIAIAASILTLSHNIAYGQHYFVLLFTNAGKLKSYELIAACFSLAMILLLLPLTVTSFQVVRRKMNAKRWKQLQRLSYLFYGLLYLHICFIYTGGLRKGKSEYLVQFALYTLLYGIYLMLRLTKAFLKKPLPTAPDYAAKRTARRRKVICLHGGISLLMFLVLLFAFRTTQTESTSAAESANSGSAASASASKAEDTGTATAGGSGIAASVPDGAYEGKGVGYNGNIKVKVTVAGGKITAIEILKTDDDEEYFYDAKKKVIQEILDRQTAEVDAASGATSSSDGIMKAVKNALQP